MTSWTLPTKQQIDTLKRKCRGDLHFYFFSKLENPAWFPALMESGLLNPNEVDNTEGQTYCMWPAAQYLIKIAPQKPKEVIDFVLKFIDENNRNIPDVVLDVILKITCALSVENKTQVIQASNKILKWLQNGGIIIHFFDYERFSELMGLLCEIEKNQLALDILENLQQLNLTIEKSKYSVGNDYDIRSKLSGERVMSDHFYKKILEDSKNIFMQKDALGLFKVYYRILNNVCNAENVSDEDKKNINWKICFNRSAIEEHSQDRHSEPKSLIISILRDIAEYIFKEKNDDDKNTIVQLLQSANADIFIRILLHLIRLYPQYNTELKENLLISADMFSGTIQSMNVYHEYYLLLAQEFGNLSAKNQEIIFDYIKTGMEKSDEETEEAKDCWRFRKLHMIRKFLAGDRKKEYEELKEKLDGYEPEHPEFTHYMTSTMGYTSPIEEDTLEKMSVDEIISYLNSWKPEGKIHAPDMHGLSSTIQQDIKKNPRKYLDDLLLFKAVPEPTYIYAIFWGIQELTDFQENNWDHFLELSEWALSFNNQSYPERDGGFDGDKNWYNVYKSIARLLRTYLRDEDKFTVKMSADNIRKVYNILSRLITMEDTWLKEPQQYSRGTDCYQRAINSMHGDALEAFIQYGLWQHKNKKDAYNVTDLIDIVLKNNPYPETFATLGAHLPWLSLINPKWFKDNLDVLLPEDNAERFNITWLTYVHFIQAFDDMYPILESKFQYVVKNRRYKGEDDSRYDTGIERHLAIYYARGKINLSDNIIEQIFKNAQNNYLADSILGFIGHFLSAEDKNGISETILKRFKDLWDYYRSAIKGLENQHKDGLKTFAMWWYKSGRFDREWALNQLYDITVTHSVKIDWFFLDTQFLEDLPKNTQKVFEITRTLALNNERSAIMHRDVLISVLNHIKETDCENSLKQEKDALIKQLMDKYGMQIYDAINPYLEKI